MNPGGHLHFLPVHGVLPQTSWWNTSSAWACVVASSLLYQVSHSLSLTVLFLSLTWQLSPRAAPLWWCWANWLLLLDCRATINWRLKFLAPDLSLSKLYNSPQVRSLSHHHFQRTHYSTLLSWDNSSFSVSFKMPTPGPRTKVWMTY
jgi:hypothetical protein